MNARTTTVRMSASVKGIKSVTALPARRNLANKGKEAKERTNETRKETSEDNRETGSERRR